MRLLLASAAALVCFGLAVPASAQTLECKSARSGEGWATSYAVYARADGTVFDTVQAFTFQVDTPWDRSGAYQVNTLDAKAGKPALGVVILKTGRRPGALPALGEFTLGAPGYFNPGDVLAEGLGGDKAKPLNHVLVWRSAKSEVLYEGPATLLNAPWVLNGSQAQVAALSLGGSDAEAPPAGGEPVAKQAQAMIDKFLAAGGSVEIVILREGKRISVGRYTVPAAMIAKAREGSAEARAEAEKRLSGKNCS